MFPACGKVHQKPGKTGREPKNLRRMTVATLNCDMGEAFGLYRMGDDEGLMPLIDIANVACGFHASDFNHMRSTVKLSLIHI